MVEEGLKAGTLVELPPAYTFGMDLRVNKTSLICIIIGVLNALLPMGDINTAIFGSYTEHEDFRAFSTIDNSEQGFTTDYDRCNPATKDSAKHEYDKKRKIAKDM
jgi:hypothetical protein